MRRQKGAAILVMLVMTFLGTEFALAEQKSIELPKGTKVEKLGPGYFRFILPNRQIVEVKGFNPKTGAVDYVGAVDPQPPSKPIAAVTGRQGQLAGYQQLKPRKLPAGTEYVLVGDELISFKAAPKIPKSDYILIDDEVTWLPITINYQVKR